MPGDSPVVVCPLELVMAVWRDDFVQSSPMVTESAGSRDVEFSRMPAAGGWH